ncbi:nicotinate-nucleotide--dimethylbenzimidazole phosphoribosyltransferase [Marinimicrobium alkaliphilum]|uniref:nicotinate-nucleotide--dimethylbenzimidazole phosphoribosyltransferase n=1 Tax=Marinimicrobium alkaliphilum TaxID=2202654 RepID=UPI001E578652|nr:nicotinate-nucleotide--dimethylbenzimidazole phosphoribosyltransferase [Marinimicrobium alkaliphilum]
MKSPTLHWLNDVISHPCPPSRSAAAARQAQLTKPPGSLGRLETLVADFAGWQGRPKPALEQVRVCVFAADHGVAAQGVSAFPQAVTTQMVANFCAGGAAVSVLGRLCQADFRVVDMGCLSEPDAHPLLIDRRQGPGTADFTRAPAMTSEQLVRAIAAGREQVVSGDFDLFIGGEMGIGNTTAASAIQAALLGVKPERVAGPGTGVDVRTIEHKQRIVAQALSRHRADIRSPLGVLRCLGGFEIAALVGAYIGAAQRGVPVLVDGYISTAAALTACRINPGVRAWLLFGHQSAEPGHRLMLRYMEAEPLLSLGMRLGEGSGAALAVPLIQSALALHREMATFAEAGVSDA